MTSEERHPLTQFTLNMLPFSDAASEGCELRQVLRLSLFQVSVGMATVMGTLLADGASGCPQDELDFPVSNARPIPFHRFRHLGVGATVARFRALARLGL